MTRTSTPMGASDDRCLRLRNWSKQGKVCALNFPVALNPGLAKAIGVMMKLDFQRALLNRIPKIEANSGTALSPGVLHLRRIPALRYCRRERAERR